MTKAFTTLLFVYFTILPQTNSCFAYDATMDETNTSTSWWENEEIVL